MTDTRKESLSALIDGEASEIEVHRLVREFRSDESLTTSWAVYQQVRATVRKGGSGSGLGPAHHEALLNRISDAVHAEDDHKRETDDRPAAGKVVMGSLALAASLVITVFLGVQSPEDSAVIADISTETSIQRPSERPAVEVQTVANDLQASELVELDEEKQKRLRAYLNQHDRMARMNANQQLVNYKDQNGN